MFDFTRHMRLLCEDIVRRTTELAHVDMTRVAVTFAQARIAAAHGLQAKLTPLRFQGGRDTETRRGRRWRIQSVVLDGREMLYILTFYLPRFLNHPRREKLATVFHELYHISEAFDGDIRRMPGRNYAHSHSRENYDGYMGRLADAYLQLKPDPDLLAFLECDFEQLQRRHGAVCGLRIRAPRLIPAEG